MKTKTFEFDPNNYPLGPGVRLIEASAGTGKTFSLELEKKGILVFKNFINDKGLDQIEQEAIKLKSKSFKSSSEYNVYILPYDPKFPKNSSRNRLMSTTKNVFQTI